VSYEWARWLDDALRAEGCKVLTYDGWQDRGRPASSGDFAPYGVLLHHTGTPTSMSNPNPTLSMCIHGRPDLSGPLCHVLIGYDGRCHVIAAGRANHAGECNGDGPTAPGDGNAQLIGFELDYSGSQDVSDPQADAAVRAAAAVLRHFHRDASYCRGHKETSNEGKWDPGRYGSSSPAYDMDGVRRAVADVLARPPGATAESEDDMTAWVRITKDDDQNIGPNETETVFYDHAASDNSGQHSDTDWPSAIRPAEGYTVASFQARLHVVGGDPRGKVWVAIRYDEVDESSKGTIGGTDYYLGDDGAGVITFTTQAGVGRGRRYRVQVRNHSGRGVTVRSGGEFSAAITRNAG
jgi:hypothetical protein